MLICVLFFSELASQIPYAVPGVM